MRSHLYFAGVLCISHITIYIYIYIYIYRNVLGLVFFANSGNACSVVCKGVIIIITVVDNDDDNIIIIIIIIIIKIMISTVPRSTVSG